MSKLILKYILLFKMSKLKSQESFIILKIKISKSEFQNNIIIFLKCILNLKKISRKSRNPEV